MPLSPPILQLFCILIINVTNVTKPSIMKAEQFEQRVTYIKTQLAPYDLITAAIFSQLLPLSAATDRPARSACYR